MLKGGCFCSRVTYEVEGALESGRCCHCSRCRKAFSGASSAYAELSAGSKVKWTGEDDPAVYPTGDGFAIGFCRTCGSTLCGFFDDAVHGLTLGCVDGDPGVEIAQHIFVGSKAPWDHIGGSAPQFEAHATAGRE